MNATELRDAINQHGKTIEEIQESQRLLQWELFQIENPGVFPSIIKEAKERNFPPFRFTTIQRGWEYDDEGPWYNVYEVDGGQNYDISRWVSYVWMKGEPFELAFGYEETVIWDGEKFYAS